MPKVGGNTIDECMSICMSDTKTIEEYPDEKKRTKVCYAACVGSLAEKEISKIIDNISLEGEQFFEIVDQDGAYIINDEKNPKILLARGKEYIFEIKSKGHPFWIKTKPTTDTKNKYEYGLSHNGIDSGTITFNVPNDAPSILYYACEFHETMKGEIHIFSEHEMYIIQLIEQYKSKM